MKLAFTKMHGLGNDFVVLDGTKQSLSLSRKQLQLLGDRHFGVGCDQILLIEPANLPEARFRFRFFNSDGGEAEQCGNGMRCLAKFALDSGLTEEKNFKVEVNNALLSVAVQPDSVTVDMGVPEFDPLKIPFRSEQEEKSYEFKLDNELIRAGVVSMGNPHCVLSVEDVSLAAVQDWGIKIQSDNRFPASVNVGFMQIMSSDRIRLRVFERGVGETLACGSGACGAVAIGINQGLLDNKVIVQLVAGELTIEWSGGNEHLYMTGPTAKVYEGRIEI